MMKRTKVGTALAVLVITGSLCSTAFGASTGRAAPDTMSEAELLKVTIQLNKFLCRADTESDKEVNDDKYPDALVFSEELDELRTVSGLKPRTRTWYEEYRKMEEYLPYKYRVNSTNNPSAIARHDLWGTTEFNPETRKLMCDNQEEYAAAVEEAVKQKGETTPYAATIGLPAFFSEKARKSIQLNEKEASGGNGSEFADELKK
ncbi:hypothetical protein [Nocardia sp. CS682]|uniref:hypothetical protein n=1 Tax=Nocardia sp. CS682 TaxID=1047172 RepID=UPI0014300E66|nr:hypothetical protein [Nocardia sp. CS682]